MNLTKFVSARRAMQIVTHALLWRVIKEVSLDLMNMMTKMNIKK